MTPNAHSAAGAGLQAVILDWAGTAVDFGSFAPTAAFIRLFAQQGVAISAAQARSGMGLMKKDHLRTILAREDVRDQWYAVQGFYPEETVAETLYTDFELRQIESIADYAAPIPGLLETVAFIRNRGWKIGATTGYTRPMMAALLPAAQRHGYTPDAWATPTDVPAGRPYPWMCYQLAIQLQVFPLTAMVKVGDTLPDIEEGLNAGMWTVGLSLSGNMLGLTLEEFSTLSPAEIRAHRTAIVPRFDAAGAHFVIDTIADLPRVLEDIDARLRRGALP